MMLLIGSLTIGLILSLLALGVYISFGNVRNLVIERET